MISVFDHPRLGEVTLSQSLRARRIAIRVSRAGGVRVSFPRGVSQRKALAFLESKIVWVECARERLAARQAALLPALPPEQEKARIEELRRAAKADLPGRIERLARQTGLRYAKMTVRAARTKWGSCSGKGNISLSLFLMTLPEHLRDFVIIHELCHTVHHDHSLVDRLVGGREKLLVRELRSYSIR